MHTRKLLFTNYLFSLDYVWFSEVNAFNFQFRFFGVKYDIFTLRICPNTHHKWPMCFLSCHFFHSNRCNWNVRCVLPILLSCHCFIYFWKKKIPSLIWANRENIHQYLGQHLPDYIKDEYISISVSKNLAFVFRDTMILVPVNLFYWKNKKTKNK